MCKTYPDKSASKKCNTLPPATLILMLPSPLTLMFSSYFLPSKPFLFSQPHFHPRFLSCHHLVCCTVHCITHGTVLPYSRDESNGVLWKFVANRWSFTEVLSSSPRFCSHLCLRIPLGCSRLTVFLRMCVAKKTSSVRGVDDWRHWSRGSQR